MVTIQPLGAAATTITANSLSVNINIRERLTRPYCTASALQPTAVATFSAGDPIFSEVSGASTGTAFVPVTATISVTYTPKGCKNAVTQIFTETFKLAYIGQTAAPTAVAISTDSLSLVSADYKTGCKAYGVSVDTAITAVIS